MSDPVSANLVDVLRGRYVRLPPAIRAKVAPLLALVPAGLRWGATYRRYRADIARSETDADFVAEYQRRKLGALIRLCLGNPCYRSLLRDAFGRTFEPDAIALEDLARLPVLTKTALREQPEMLLVRPASQMDSVSTSGTSGRPFRFYLDRDRGAKEWAFHHHAWSRIGYRLGHKRAVLRGIHIPDVDKKPWAYDPALRELQLSPFHLTAEVMKSFLQQIRARGIHFLHGYPSALSILAGEALRTGWEPPATLRGVITISESLFSHQRERIQAAFPGAMILGQYGLSEKVAYAGEVVGAPDVYEFEPLYGRVELLDDEGRTVTEPGRVGRIVATGFLSLGMPFVRYDTGDFAQLVRPPDPANAYRLRVRGIRSRWNQEFLVGRNGALISIAAVNVHSPAYARAREFEFFQDTPGEAEFRVVPAPGCTERDLRPLVAEMQKKVGATIKFRLTLCDTTSMNARGKRRFIDQRLDLGRLSSHGSMERG